METNQPSLPKGSGPADDADGKRGPCGQPRAVLDLMWEDQHFIDDNTLNVYITRVRRKLRELGAGDLIETVREQAIGS